MEKHDLKHGWTLLASHEKLLILEDNEGNVGITFDIKQLGDPQLLLLTISEDEVKVRGLPHYVDGVSININKTITISLSEFVDTFDTEEQAEI